MTVLPIIAERVPDDTEAGLGCLRGERGNLPLHAIEVDATVTALLHETRLRQTFSNPHDEPIEATYIFPLPDRAAVTAFRMEVADRIIDGELRERGAAREVYDEAIAAGRRAAIAEEERPNIFTVRVGNLLPGEHATVQLTLAGPLAVDSGEATWRFPLVVAPRYIPGTPLSGPPAGDGTALDTDAVPDASRITPPVLLPGFPNPVALSLRIALDAAGLPVDRVRTSLAADLDDGVVTVRPGLRLDRDFVLRFDIVDDTVATSAAAHGGTVAVTVVPPREFGAASHPRDVVFVLDRSGSMQGWKMIAARRAVARMIDTLSAADRFAVLAFDNTVETLDAGLSAATDRLRFRAVEYLAALDARGGTEMLRPLIDAVSLLADAGRERVLVLATDGQVGNEDQILAELGAKSHGVRIFTVGIDTAVNDAFLRRLAAAGGGACEVVESEDRLDEVMDRIHRRIGMPVLTGLVVTGDGLDAASLAPARVTTLHAGAPLTVFGRWSGEVGDTVTVTGTGTDGQPWSAEVPVTAGPAAIAAVGARARIRDLEDRYVVSPSPDLEHEIVRTSIDGHVLSRFTAFVAVGTAVVNEGGAPRRITQPVDAPAGWDMFGAAAPLPQAAMPRYAAGGMAASTHNVKSVRPMAAPPMVAVPSPSTSPGRAARVEMSRSTLTGGRANVVEERMPVALDLSPYRERAARLVRRAADGELDAYALRRDVTDLVDDLRSVGASAEALAATLAELPAQPPADLDDPVWAAVLAALRGFADAVPDAGPARKAFWKR